MSGNKCKNCGSADIEIDSARGDAVCTACGSVLEDNIIVSEVQFEETAGSSSTVGQFVSADSKGGGASVYGKFHVGGGRESREVTLKKARDGITHLCQQLSLNNHCIETACNFFKMALNRHLTRGRKNSHIYAACVYITCRTEGTSHLLIDISDILRICCYELGRTYLKLTQALCINIPSVDPCLYIMRFANKLEFGEKTHEVSMTAQRLVQRMKKDSIHSGRRPSGLCGAALLLAARMHDFSRTPIDVVKIVKIHESTLRKRLLEFGDTPSSILTIDEFMTVDLEAEQDPPAFKAARKKDKEMIQKVAENDKEFTELQKEIEAQLEKDMKKNKRKVSCLSEEVGLESSEDQFIRESTLTTINECMIGNNLDQNVELEKELANEIAPDLMAICNQKEIDYTSSNVESELASIDHSLEDLDDDEINSYILTEDEAKRKNEMWKRLNAEYLTEARCREERLAKEREEGKPEKKRRKLRKKQIEPSTTAGEAIEKMLQEKKISNKINYDILKSLTANQKTHASVIPKQEVERDESPIGLALPRRKKINPNFLIPSKSNRNATMPNTAVVPIKETVVNQEDDDEDYQEQLEIEPEPEVEKHSSLKEMLNDGNEDDYFGYEEEY